MPDLKAIADIVTGIAAIVAAVASLKAHGEAKEANAMITTVRTEVSNVLHLTQNLSHVQQSVTVYTAGERPSVIAAPDLTSEQVPGGELAGGTPTEPTE